MTLKGRQDGEAVLCTETATFTLKTVETTNSLMLVEASPWLRCISGSVHSRWSVHRQPAGPRHSLWSWPPQQAATSTSRKLLQSWSSCKRLCRHARLSCLVLKHRLH